VRWGQRALVALTLLASYGVSLMPAAREKAVASSRAAGEAAPAARPGVTSLPARPAPIEPAVTDVFAVTSWAPPPLPVPLASTATPAAAAPTRALPAAPVAPAVPFVYVGRYLDGSKQVVMLLRGEQLLLVQQGETIDKLYRLERVASDVIELTYLPLQVRQSVRTLDPA
jgi:hypothetical protein